VDARRGRRVHALAVVDKGGSTPATCVVSEAQAREWRRVTRIDTVLSPFVPTARIPWTDRSGEGAVYAGRLSPDKGVAEAMRVQTGGLGGAFVWPALLRKAERMDASYKT